MDRSKTPTDIREDPTLVFDLGAHRGEDTDFYLKLGYRVVAVEANPALVAELEERFRDAIRRGELVVVGRAIGEREGTIRFFVNRTISVWGTADPAWAERNRKLGADSEEIAVECVRLPDLIRRHGCPHYLKVDVEGADMQCVRSLAELDCRPKYLSLESSKVSWSDLADELATCEALGYTRFKVVGQRWHGGGRFDTTSGARVTHSFERGASGPFGPHLRGRWLTRRQAMLRYVPIFILYKTLGDATFVGRHLGRLPFLRRVLAFIVGWYDTHAMRA